MKEQLTGFLWPGNPSDHVLFKSRVKLVQGLPKVFPVEVRIDLGCGDAFVPQHFLYGPQVGPAFHQVCGKGMAQGMRGEILVNASFLCQLFQHQKDHNPAEFATPPVQE